MPLAGVGVAGKVDDNVKCGGNSVLCSSFWHSCGKGQSEQAMGDVTGTISVDGGKASPVAGVECGKEVNGFIAAYFSDDNTVGSHAKCLPHQDRHGNATASFRIVIAGNELDELWVVQVKFGSVFNADKPLLRG
jgi:hypothetical protein